MNYTKGKWKFAKGDFNCACDRCNGISLGSIIADDGEGEPWFIAKLENVAEQDANAHLIKAAPLMIEALKDLTHDFTTLAELYGMSSETIENVLTKSNKATAAAEGK